MKQFVAKCMALCPIVYAVKLWWCKWSCRNVWFYLCHY